MQITRRDFLAAALALAASNSRPITARPKLREFPFTLGVASGEPQPDGIVLWTRLAPHPLEPESMPATNIPVEWEIAEDERFTRIARRGTAMATPALAHSVHVEAEGLRSGRWYWYRFQADGERS